MVYVAVKLPEGWPALRARGPAKTVVTSTTGSERLAENSDVLLASVAVLVSKLPLSRAVCCAAVRLLSGMVKVN